MTDFSTDSKFSKWLDTFVEEKELDTDIVLEVEGKRAINYIPLECLLKAIKQAPSHEQEEIKAMLIKIDFWNGDVIGYFRHHAQTIAV